MRHSSEIIELHHTAYVVKDLEQAIPLWNELVGAKVELPPTLIAVHGVRVCFLRTGNGRIELVESVEGNSAIGTHDRADGHPDHVCFLCADFDARIERARSHSGIVVRPPVPSEAFRDKRMCFVFYKDIGLVEWVER